MSAVDEPPKVITRTDLEQVICGAHDAMILLDIVIDDLHDCVLKEEDWKRPICVAGLIQQGHVMLCLTKDQYRALDVAKLHAFAATRAAEETFLKSAGAIE